MPLRSRAQVSCPGPPPVRGTANGDIFTDTQEMQLGDIMAARFERDFRPIPDKNLNAYLNNILQKLVAQMPPTQLRFRVALVNIPVANAFTLPGGRIYVTRKLVAFVRSEDELAAILAHELGHAITHEPAANASRAFRQVLGVTKVGDRQDIFLKYNEILENANRKELPFDTHEGEQQQIVADSYALYALARAGYNPRALIDFWERFTGASVGTGNWLTDLFRTSPPSEQRLRSMLANMPVLPAACIASHTKRSPAEFREWQQAVIGYEFAGGNESLPGLLWKRALVPPLESSITHVRFSPDGGYVLAQDEFSVYVLSRTPFQFLFRIPAENVEPASFTPDSKSVLIWTPSLHIEKWSISIHKRIEVHEVVTREPCLQAVVSPNGSEVACVQANDRNDGLQFNLSLLDTATGSSVILKPNFYDPGVFAPGLNDLVGMALLAEHIRFFNMHFSPDGRYFAISRNSTAFAWDMQNRSRLRLSSAVKGLMSGEFTFDGPDRIVGYNVLNPRDSGSAQFPAGPVDARITLSRQVISAPTRSSAVFVRPAGKFAVGLVDLKTGKGLVGSHMPVMDVYDHVYVRPRLDGSIGLYDVRTLRALGSAIPPKHWIGRPRSASLSADLKWFAASGSSRGAVWNLVTGDRVFHVRGFGACSFSPDDVLYAGFNSFMKQKRSIASLDPATGKIEELRQIEDGVQAAESGKYLVYVRHNKNGLQLEVHNAVTGAILWTKQFSLISPEIFFSSSHNTMSLMLRLDSREAKEAENLNPKLLIAAKGINAKETARLIQLVRTQDGKVLGEFIVDTGRGSFAIRDVLSAGNWVILTDNMNRVLVYTPAGELKGRLFGTNPAVSAKTNEIAVQEQGGSLEIFDLANFSTIEELNFGKPVAFYQFAADGSKLFTVTDDQTAYLLQLPARAN